MLHPNILVLKEGTEDNKGKEQIISNINACQSVVEIVKTTLGPRGLDKMICGENSTTVSNDGATIIKLLDINHPAAKSLAEVAKSQDNEVGDGTTSVMIFSGELLKEAKQFIEDGMSPQVIINGFWKALCFAREKLKSAATSIKDADPETKRDMLLKCAETALNSKLIANKKDFFAKMIVKAVEKLEGYLDKDLIGIKHVTGGSVDDSFLVEGVAFSKSFSYAGFEQQPKRIEKPKIIILNVELELKAEKDNAEIRIENPEDYQKLIDAEWKIIIEKLDNIVKSGARVVLSKLVIGDLATQYFAEKGIFCAGRVKDEDIKRIAKATGALLLHSCNKIDEKALGSCGLFEEKQVGEERYNIFSECPETKTVTIVLRGGAEQFIEESERSINDAVMVVRRATKAESIVPGGGAIEMELSKYVREQGMKIAGKQQLVVLGFARALEIIPKTLAGNSGYDSVDIINKLRQRHASEGGENYGVNCFSGGIIDTYKEYVWEPTVLKSNVLAAATEAACTILSVDQTVRNPKSEQAQQDERKRALQRAQKMKQQAAASAPKK
ncbi:MAG: T-complex protein 1 subunit eta [archaeon]|nr:T-complex protein 1 subunit eta [archaeon]